MRNNSHPETARAAEPHNRRLSCWASLAILASLAAAASVALLYGYRWHLLRAWPPSQRAFVERMKSERITLPPRWATENPKDVQKVIDANREFDRVIRPFRTLWLSAEGPGSRPRSETLRALRRGTPVSEEEWSTISLLVAALAPALKQTSEAVALSGYAHDTHEVVNEPPADLMGLRYFAQGAALTGFARARDGDWDGAFDVPLLAIKKSVHFEESPMSAAFFANVIQEIEIQTIDSLTSACPNIGTLERALATLTEWRPRVLPPVSDLAVIHTATHNLHVMRRNGYLKELADGQSASYYWQLYSRTLPGYPGWMLNHIPPTHPGRSALEQQESMMSENRVPRDSFLVPFVPSTRMLILHSNVKELVLKHNDTSARYDLLRLRIAQRIAELRGEPLLAAARDVVPKYLPTEPLDPFVLAPFRFHAPTGVFYSVGPDGRDDGTSVRYFPSEEWAAPPGDIWLGE